MSEMERRIVGKLDHISECLPKLENQVDTNKEEIEKLRKRSDIVDAVEGALMLVVSIFFGTKN
jgi:hypothetical protein